MGKSFHGQSAAGPPGQRRSALLKRNARGASNLAKPELGTKRECPSCGAKFYDLNKTPLVCPKCQHEFVPEVPKAPKRAKPAAEKPKKKEPEKPAPGVDDDEDETSAGDISLEELEDDFDEDSDDDEDDIDLDDDDSDDDTFLEDDEDDDDDVSGIVRGGKDDTD
jgi:uncharacterized protein (TIGR02300 family)